MLLHAKNRFYKCHFFLKKVDLFIVTPKQYMQISGEKLKHFDLCKTKKKKTNQTPNVTFNFVFSPTKALLYHMA